MKNFLLSIPALFFGLLLHKILGIEDVPPYEASK